MEHVDKETPIRATCSEIPDARILGDYSHDEKWYNLAFSSDGTLLAAGSYDWVYLWDVNAGVLLKRSKILGCIVHSLAISADNTKVVYGVFSLNRGGKQGIVRWDVLADKHTIVFETGNSVWHSAARHLRLQPDGIPLLSMSDEPDFPLTAMKLAMHACNDVDHCGLSLQALSKDKRLFACKDGNKTGAIFVWDLKTDKCKNVLRGATMYPHSVAISPDGKFVASANRGGIIRMWSCDDGICKYICRRKGTLYEEIAISGDSKRIAASDSAGRITIWQPVWRGSDDDDFDPDVEFADIKSAAKTS